MTAIPAVLSLLGKRGTLKGKVATADAMGCQKAIAGMIHRAGAFCLFNLEGSHAGLHEEVISLLTKGLAGHPGKLRAETFDSGWSKIAGRVERRRLTLVRLRPFALQWLTKASGWAGIKSVMRVEREVERPGAGKAKDFKTTRHFMSSASSPPRRTLDVAVERWMVETVRNTLDVSLKEDN
jgi:predicted transposase YbfD/YdcC